jgi:hypothetical protein
MLVSEAYSLITWNIGTPDDDSKRAINAQCTNKVILLKLQEQLQSYANITKGITDVYSFPQNQNITFVEAPSLALRSQGYFFGYVVVNGTRFPFDFRGSNDALNTFRTAPVMGIMNWVMPWNAGHTQYLTAFPKSSTNAKTTTLTSDITAVSTTIPVTSSAGYIADFGRLTIGTERILYQYKDATNFYGCERGVEQTVAAIHTSGDTVTENNVILLYARLPVSIALTNPASDVIPAGILAQVLEPCDEHMEGIINIVSSKLLNKIDPERAKAYLIEYDQTGIPMVYMQYKKDIARGYGKTRQYVNVRDPFLNESGVSYGNNLL